MKQLIPLLLALIACEAISFFELHLTEWEEFKMKYGKKYVTDEEDAFRMKIYLEKKLKIEKHNLEYEKGIHTYKLGMNKFGDLLPHEYMTNYYNPINTSSIEVNGATFITPENIRVPEEIDWREKGAVTGVKDIGDDCIAYWAFSAVGALEGQHFRKTGNLTSLSEQNLIDCSRRYGNRGCGGGLPMSAYKYIKENGGIDTEVSYLYEGKEDNCRYNPATSGATDTGTVLILKRNETLLMEIVATVGPVSAFIYVPFDDSFQMYYEGVYYSRICKSVEFNQIIVVVGYGRDETSGQDYWLVKNSWGPKWGERGYIKMSRNRNNNCGIASIISYPLV